MIMKGDDWQMKNPTQLIQLLTLLILIILLVIVSYVYIFETEPIQTENLTESNYSKKFNITGTITGTPKLNTSMPMIIIECSWVTETNWTNKNLSLYYHNKSKDIDMLEICKSLEGEK